jgi:hypothetical protein
MNIGNAVTPITLVIINNTDFTLYYTDSVTKITKPIPQSSSSNSGLAEVVLNNIDSNISVGTNPDGKSAISFNYTAIVDISLNDRASVTFINNPYPPSPVTNNDQLITNDFAEQIANPIKLSTKPIPPQNYLPKEMPTFGLKATFGGSSFNYIVLILIAILILFFLFKK